MKLNELKGDGSLKLVLYGDSGTGKTCFMTTMPGPIWVADFDEKISSAAQYLKEVDPKKLDQIDYENFGYAATNGGLRVFKKFEATLGALEASVKDGKFKFGTVVIDSLTSMSRALMQDVMQDSPGTKRVAPGTPCLQDYSVFGNRFIPIISRVKALPCNVLCIAHVKTEKDEATGVTTCEPMMQGQLSKVLPVMFEEVYRSYIESKDGARIHMAQTKGDGRFTTRTQLRGLPAAIKLDYKSIVEHIK